MEVTQISSSLVSNSTSLALPTMHALSSLLLLGGYAAQVVFGRPDPEAARFKRKADVLKRDVDSFIATEEPIAYAQILCNVGPSGCHASGVGSGLVLASPSQSDPDCT